MQIPLFKPQTEWVPPTEFPDLSKHDEIAIDLETKDPDLVKMGSRCIKYTIHKDFSQRHV